MGKIRIGVIADDFTGAGDAASFLVKSGYQTVLLTDIPERVEFECECIVTALKVRSVEPDEAITAVKKVYEFYKRIGAEKVYFKYSSTFDSSPRGNIGVIADWLMEQMDVSYTVLCPSLPVNGRTVKAGILNVKGVPLAQSSMGNHPLNPMWDSYVPALMKDQSKYPCFILERTHFSSAEVEIEEWKLKNRRFYIVPDYENDVDAKYIVDIFGVRRLLTGGSGLLEFLLPRKETIIESNKSISTAQKAILLSGSCSATTRKQIHTFIDEGGIAIAVDSKELMDGSIQVSDVFRTVLANLPLPTLVYSEGVDSLERDTQTFPIESRLLEDFFSVLSYKANLAGFDKIIVAGGETSGAVTLRLGYKSYFIGKVLAPGVPTLIPVDQPNLTLILKSGNFGDEHFFKKALS